MTEDREKIERLQTRLDNLVRTQVDFQKHVSYIREELERLKRSSSEPTITEPKIYQAPKTEPLREPGEKHQPPRPVPPPRTTPMDPPIFHSYSDAASAERVERDEEKARSSLEKFVGENLLSTVGIVILIVGVAIGAKYAIDQGWISPVIRIVFGYVTGFTLIGFAVRLRSKYEAFSAVLTSGGMAVMFFITFFAYSLYQLIGQTTAFLLMVVITVFAVAAAISYSRQMIAHLGLVGAYAVPFLLSNDSGRFDILFSYIAIINVGILVVCLNRYWKPLFYTSFIFTWVTFLGWYLDRFRDPEHFWLAFIFNGIFFLIFYISFIGYKFRSGENVASENVVTILANSVIFYGFGYAFLKDHAGFEGYLGLFTIANAAIHLLFAATANKIKTASIDFVYLLGSLVLTFITISIPVQFDGQIITLAWTVEAALLFVIGRAVAIELYEYFSYSLIVLASVSLFNDYGRHLDSIDTFLSTATSFPFLNSFFVTSVVFVAAFTLIYAVNRNITYEVPGDEDIRSLIKYVVAGMGTFVLYNAFRLQISDYFTYLSYASRAGDSVNIFAVESDVYLSYSIVWQINYTMLFVSTLALINIVRFRSMKLAVVNLGLELLSLIAFLTAGLLALSSLRASYIRGLRDGSPDVDIFQIGIRYVSYLFVVMVVVTAYTYLRSGLFFEHLALRSKQLMFEMPLALALFFILSSELLNIMDLAGQKDSYKLGLSIFWGIYSLVLAGIGIALGRQHLRLMAIVLFGITLLKLFFYDLDSLDTLSKTAVFVSLGVLMLLVSFLYHKYKAVISNSDDLGEHL